MFFESSLVLTFQLLLEVEGFIGMLTIISWCVSFCYEIIGSADLRRLRCPIAEISEVAQSSLAIEELIVEVGIIKSPM